MPRSLQHQAWEAARKRVVEAHPEEFNRYVDEERAARGLPPLTDRLQERLAAAEAEVQRLRARLGVPDVDDG